MTPGGSKPSPKPSSSPRVLKAFSSDDVLTSTLPIPLFPDYVSAEARDILSTMLVPDPMRRADLRLIMAHPWLSAYAHIFSNGVEDLERATKERH
ncbi:hypothetical protein EV363DRAFT_1394973 [Boletus edulis]|nr:hypothetical protein EV363DRAFT_1394973 [Boletus edulis]